MLVYIFSVAMPYSRRSTDMLYTIPAIWLRMTVELLGYNVVIIYNNFMDSFVHFDFLVVSYLLF